MYEWSNDSLRLTGTEFGALVDRVMSGEIEKPLIMILMWKAFRQGAA